MVDIDAGARRDGHRHIIAQSIEADSLVTPFGGENVNRHRTVGYRRGAERNTVKGTDNREHQERPGSYISGETDEKEKETKRQHFFPFKRVDDKPAERTHQQCRYHISRKHKPYQVLIGMKLRVEIKGKQWSQQIESKKEQKVARHDLDILPIPESRLHACLPSFPFYGFHGFLHTRKAIPQIQPAGAKLTKKNYPKATTAGLAMDDYLSVETKLV